MKCNKKVKPLKKKNAILKERFQASTLKRAILLITIIIIKSFQLVLVSFAEIMAH
jgi:hypothetical protein